MDVCKGEEEQEEQEEQEGRGMYQIGDIVVYGTEGIAEIGEEIEREFDGQKLKYLVLHPLEKKTETVYVRCV